jgi:hypothetical protein
MPTYSEVHTYSVGKANCVCDCLCEHSQLDEPQATPPSYPR